MRNNDDYGGTIYVFGAERFPYIKIGSTTKRVSARLKQVQQGMSVTLSVLASFPVRTHLREIEITLHGFLAEYRAHGEWFTLRLSQAQLETLIQRAQDLYISPSDFSPLEAGCLGSRIAGKRVERQLKQVELARRAQVSQSLIAQFELGHRPGMTFDAVMKIATALECSLDWIAWGESGRPSPSVLLEDKTTGDDELAVC